ncbi:hypothetical protein A2U01_0068461 [Trifolium medium]|uniref:Uncharacterized protein n=1 Tax=Trifolium medium TaxID=97028 RepID=A0A392SGY6_9FABA|nr:hypothetical protein [Trifolium medium]
MLAAVNVLLYIRCCPRHALLWSLLQSYLVVITIAKIDVIAFAKTDAITIIETIIITVTQQVAMLKNLSM